MSNIASLVQAVKSFLSSHHMLACETWIEGCVEYLCAEGTTNVKEIQEIAYQQWLLHDLKDICPGCLPANLSALQKMVLNGQYVLQINGAMDISVPAYQQYLKMKKTDIENIKATMNPEEKISQKRMIKFDMTDGNQKIAGIEYETITKIKTELVVPGCKVLITGPVQCRLGMLLLTDASVQLLGGEVPEMAASHSLAALLAAKLGLPVIDVNTIESVEITQTTNENCTNTSSTVTQNSTNTVPVQNPGINRDDPRVHHLEQSNTISSTNTRISDSSGRISGNEVIDLETYETFGKRQLSAESSGPEKRIKVDPSPVVNMEEYPDDDELAELMFEDEEHLREIESEFEQQLNRSMDEALADQGTSVPTGPALVPSEPFVYIKQINELSDSDKLGKVFRVKAQILTVLTKLTMTAEQRWSLKCVLVDGTGAIDVEFASDILAKFLGFSPRDISELKKKVATNPEIKEQINLAYSNTRKTLETLYCIIELTMYVLPQITRLIDFDDSHLDLLNKRLSGL